MAPPIRPIEERFWLKVIVLDDDQCWEWTSTKLAQGYGTIWDNDRKLQKRAHRLSWEIANGPIPEGAVIRHLCHNTSCVNPHHLASGTAKDNGADQQTNPNHAQGERHPMAKLTYAHVRRIRSLRGARTQDSLAEEYGVTQNLISKIQLYRIWRRP